MLERDVFLPVCLVVEYGVAVKKSAAAAVLAYHATIDTFFDEAGISHGLGEAPVHVDLASRHFYALCNDPLHPAVRHESGRQGSDRLAKFRHQCRANRRIDRIVPVTAQVWAPVDREFVADHAER